MQYKHAFELYSGSVDRNRTCIWSFGNSYTIHCTTTPEKNKHGLLKKLAKTSLFYQPMRIGGKDFYRNGQQNYAKKFTHCNQSCRT